MNFLSRSRFQSLCVGERLFNGFFHFYLFFPLLPSSLNVIEVLLFIFFDDLLLKLFL